MDKFRHKLPKEELKRLGKEIAKKLVASDYKNRRVDDPTAPLTEKQTLKIKKYVKDFLTRAVQKYDEHQKKQSPAGSSSKSQGQSTAGLAGIKDVDSLKDMIGNENENENGDGDEGDEDMASDMDSPSSQDHKRKRETVAVAESSAATPCDSPSTKRIRCEDASEPSPPPPPPPPPDSATDEPLNEEQEALKEQEEALMRENEEAQRLEDEANRVKGMEGRAGGVHKGIALAA